MTDEGRCAALIREGLALDATLNPAYYVDGVARGMALVLVQEGTATDDEVRVANETVRRATNNRTGVMIGELHELAHTPDAPERAALWPLEPPS